MPATVQLFYFDAGGGHRASAVALKTVIERQGYPWDVQLVNFQELMDPLDLLRRLTGLRIQDFYNLMLKNRWTLGTTKLLRVLHAGIRKYHAEQVERLVEFWADATPVLAVSLIPHFNRVLAEALARVSPSTPFVTILTDLADYPPHFWIEPDAGYVICGTDRAVQQARELGVDECRIFRVSGMIVRPDFYDPIEVDREAERLRLGLEPAVPTGLILFGSHAPGLVADLVERVASSGLEVQLIVICGRNAALAEELRARRFRIPVHVVGFTDRVPYYMHLADFFIGKPGPGSISEALVKNLPVIVECNAFTLPQERYNAQWILEQGVGIVVKSFREIDSALARLLAPGQLEEYRTRARSIEIKAVFEIPRILASLISSARAPVTD